MVYFPFLYTQDEKLRFFYLGKIWPTPFAFSDTFNCQQRSQLYLLPLIYIPLLAMTLRTNLESVSNGAMNTLKPEFFSL